MQHRAKQDQNGTCGAWGIEPCAAVRWFTFADRMHMDLSVELQINKRQETRRCPGDELSIVSLELERRLDLETARPQFAQDRVIQDPRLI